MLKLVISDQNGVLDEVRIVNKGTFDRPSVCAAELDHDEWRRYGWEWITDGVSYRRGDAVTHNRKDGRFTLIHKVFVAMREAEDDVYDSDDPKNDPDDPNNAHKGWMCVR